MEQGHRKNTTNYERGVVAIQSYHLREEKKKVFQEVIQRTLSVFIYFPKIQDAKFIGLSKITSGGEKF